MDQIFTKNPSKVLDGIRCYTDKNFYWGIVPRQEMEGFNILAREKGFAVASKKYSFSGRFDYAESYRRADFHFLLPISKEAVVLDLGSGFGNVTIPMAKYHTKVVAADASLPLLEFSKFRAESEGVKNIEYVHIDPLEQCNLPFKPESFDAIVLNGVLEWVGPAITDVSPRELQLRFLQQLRALLKRDGVLYVGIENRMFPGWLSRDPHSKLKWTSILPRQAANWYAKKNGILEGYRTYIYSSLGYQALLGEADFPNTFFYYPHTSYREPNYIYPSAIAVRKYLSNVLYSKIYTKKWRYFLELSSFFGLQYFFLSSFMILASSKDRSLKTSFLFHLVKEKYHDIDPTTSFLKIHSDGDDAAFLAFKEAETKPFLEIRIPRLWGESGQISVTEI